MTYKQWSLICQFMIVCLKRLALPTLSPQVLSEMNQLQGKIEYHANAENWEGKL